MRTITSLMILFMLIASCKRHRKVNIGGTVSDQYTNQPIGNVEVRLISEIGDGKYGEYKEYSTYTDSEGKYKFDNAYFANPGFSGVVEVHDTNGNYVSTVDGNVEKKEVKLLGKTNLTKNLEARCLSKLNLIVSINSSYNWRTLKVSHKFVGTRPIGLEDFSTAGYYTSYGSNSLPTNLTGYSDGKTIYKSELSDSFGNILKTHYDTLISLGCGKNNCYTLNLN